MMKVIKICIIILLCVFTTSCDCGCFEKDPDFVTNIDVGYGFIEEVPVLSGNDILSSTTRNPIRVIIIDSCEYLYVNMYGLHGSYSLVHKGNCIYCRERQKKLIEKTVKEALLNDKN